MARFLTDCNLKELNIALCDRILMLSFFSSAGDGVDLVSNDVTVSVANHSLNPNPKSNPKSNHVDPSSTAGLAASASATTTSTTTTTTSFKHMSRNGSYSDRNDERTKELSEVESLVCSSSPPPHSLSLGADPSEDNNRSQSSSRRSHNVRAARVASVRAQEQLSSTAVAADLANPTAAAGAAAAAGGGSTRSSAADGLLSRDRPKRSTRS